MLCFRGNIRLTAGAIASAALFTTSIAGAQSAPLPPPPPGVETQPAQPDVLQLTDGTTLRGRVLELRLFQDATIQLDDGSLRTVTWSALASGSADIWNLQAAANWRPPPITVIQPIVIAPPAPVETPFDFFHPGPGRVALRVESDGAQQNVGIGDPYRRRQPMALLCQTPCTLFVYPGVFRLYTGGPDARPAVHPVYVTASGAHVIAHAGSATSRGLGAVMIAGGALALVGGGAEMGNSYAPGPVLSATLALGGIAAIVAGAVMVGRARPGLQYIGPMNNGIGLSAAF